MPLRLLWRLPELPLRLSIYLDKKEIFFLNLSITTLDPTEIADILKDNRVPTSYYQLVLESF